MRSTPPQLPPPPSSPPPLPQSKNPEPAPLFPLPTLPHPSLRPTLYEAGTCTRNAAREAEVDPSGAIALKLPFGSGLTQAPPCVEWCRRVPRDPFEEEDTRMSYEEEDTCMSYEDMHVI